MKLIERVTISPWTMALVSGTFQWEDYQNILTFYSKGKEVHDFKIVVVTQLLVNQSQNVFSVRL